MSDDPKISDLVNEALSPEQKAAADAHLAATKDERDAHIKDNSDWLELQRKQREAMARGEADLPTGDTQ
jgi:hypothetical protein